MSSSGSGSGSIVVVVMVMVVVVVVVVVEINCQISDAVYPVLHVLYLRNTGTAPTVHYYTNHTHNTSLHYSNNLVLLYDQRSLLFALCSISSIRSLFNSHYIFHPLQSGPSYLYLTLAIKTRKQCLIMWLYRQLYRLEPYY